MKTFVKSNLFFLILLTGILFCLYGKSISFDFTDGDDTNLVLHQADFLSDIKNLPTIFTVSCYYSKDFPYYRPLLNLSFMLETVIFGINTKVYHFTNIILFILALYLMYVFLSKLKLNDTVLKYLILLVAVHPIFTSSVVWIPARNDTLLAVFIYASFVFFVNYLENKKLKDLILYFLFFALALFTKESSILLIFLYALFVWCFNYNLSKKEIIKNIFIAFPIIIFYLFFRHIAVSGGNVLSYLQNFNENLQNMIVGSAMYIYQFVVPDISMCLYNVKINPFQFAVVSISVLFVMFYLYKKFVDKKIFFWCFTVYVFFVFPTCLLDDYIVLNHRLVTVIPAIIIFLTFVVDKIIKFKKMKYIISFLFVVLFLIYSGISFIFANNYREKNIYWVQSYIDAPNCHATIYWIGRLYFEYNNFKKAEEFFIKANELKPIYLSDLALLYYLENKIDEAEQLYKYSIKLQVNKSKCYRNLSTIYLKRDKDIDKAIEYAKLAVNEDPFDTSYKEYLQLLINEKNKNI